MWKFALTLHNLLLLNSFLEGSFIELIGDEKLVAQIKHLQISCTQ